jgi:serine/threonine protein kinase
MKGSFGKVKLARHIFTGHVVAIKIIDKIHAPVVTQEVITALLIID